MQAKLLRNDALCCETQEAGALARLGKRGALIRLVAFVCVRGDTLCPRSLRVRTAWSQGGKTTSLRACLQTHSVSDEAARVRLALTHSYKKATRVLMSCLQGARLGAGSVEEAPTRPARAHAGVRAISPQRAAGRPLPEYAQVTHGPGVCFWAARGSLSLISQCRFRPGAISCQQSAVPAFPHRGVGCGPFGPTPPRRRQGRQGRAARPVARPNRGVNGI